MSNISRPPLDTLSKSKKIPLTAEVAEREMARMYRQDPPEDFRVLRKKASRQRGWLWLTTTLLVVIIAGGIWFVFFSGQNTKFGEEAVKVKLSGPVSAPSGQMINYTLSWNNDQGVGLNSLEVNFRYSTGFTVIETSKPADNEAKTRFLLGQVDAKGSGELVIIGQMVGEVGEIKEMAAVFTYEPENFKAQFAKTTVFSTELIASVVTIDLEAPTQLPFDQDLALKVKYNNTSTAALPNLALKFISPSGFELDLPKLEPVIGETNLWKLIDLSAKSVGELEFTGRFTTSASAGIQDFSVAIGVINDDNSFTIQEEKKISVTLIESHLTLSLTANQVALKSYADWGEQIDFELRYANEGEIALSNLVLETKLDPELLDWTSWQTDTPANVKGTENAVVWTKNELPSLASIAPGTKGSINFRLKIVSVAPNNMSPYSFNTSVKASAEQLIGGKLQPVTTESNIIITKINTQLSIQAEGRYYTDQLIKIGSGPLPPRVGSTTTYNIFWRLANTINEANNVEVTTTLPQDVIWTGQTTVSHGQPLTYNPNTREVRWELNRLPVGAGFKFDKPEASFEVAITPTEQDADKILVLVKTTTATALDSYSGADLIATAKMVTTELDDDLGAQGKGVVAR